MLKKACLYHFCEFYKLEFYWWGCINLDIFNSATSANATNYDEKIFKFNFQEVNFLKEAKTLAWAWFGHFLADFVECWIFVKGQIDELCNWWPKSLAARRIFTKSCFEKFVAKIWISLDFWILRGGAGL